MTARIFAAGRVRDSRKVCTRFVCNHFQLDEVVFDEKIDWVVGRTLSGDRVSRLHYLSALLLVSGVVFLNLVSLLVVLLNY